MSFVRNREALVSEDDSGRRALALDMIEGALSAVEPRRTTREALSRATREGLALGSARILALGKAARPMAEAAVDSLGARDGIVIGPSAEPIGELDVRAGEHPVSGRRAIDNGEALMSFARRVPAGASVVCLVSGGGSAMAEVPAAGIGPADLAAAHEALLASGAPIEVVNRVRRGMSELKGGGLARALAHARVVTIILSDVPGLPPSTVASGPTVAPEPEDHDLEVVLRRHGLDRSLPAPVLAALRAPAPDADVPGSPILVAADNATAVRAAASVARDRGLPTLALDEAFAGEARTTGARLLAAAREHDGVAVVAGGETTVTLRGGGRGGRNHEICLGALPEYRGGLVVGFGTDGVDGTSGAAGALLDEDVVRRAASLDLDPDAHLEDNDSAAFFARTGAQILTGPTTTNVADLWIHLPPV